MSGTTLNIEYDSAYHLTLDRYLPKRFPVATIIVIHGGGWFRGDKQKDADWAKTLADYGYEALVPNYRLTPTAYYPAPLTDMDQLMAWINKQPEYQDRHIGVFGSSAGGNMAVELSIKYGIPCASLSGILDIEDWLAQHENVVAKPDQTQDFDNTVSAQINQTGANDSFYKWFVTNYFQDEIPRYHEATPDQHVTKQTGPMYLANSVSEFVPVSGMLNMATALTENQVPFTMRLLKGSQHAKGYLDDVAADVLNFFEQML